jgi:hypothetical protein
MSIDQESNGVPEVNVHRPATQVNLWMIGGILFFFVVMAAVAFWVSRHEAPPKAADQVTRSSRP